MDFIPSESSSQTSPVVKPRNQWDSTTYSESISSQTSSAIKQRNQRDSTIYSNSEKDNCLFTKEQNWEIKMNNHLIQKKIKAAMTKPSRPVSPFIKPAGKSSAAINQALKAREILNENKKMSLRIKNVKSTINR